MNQPVSFIDQCYAIWLKAYNTGEVRLTYASKNEAMRARNALYNCTRLPETNPKLPANVRAARLSCQARFETRADGKVDLVVEARAKALSFGQAFAPGESPESIIGKSASPSAEHVSDEALDEFSASLSNITRPI